MHDKIFHRYMFKKLRIFRYISTPLPLTGLLTQDYLHVLSGAGTNLKLGARVWCEAPNFFVVPLHSFRLYKYN